jgi:hypothetical protein
VIELAEPAVEGLQDHAGEHERDRPDLEARGQHGGGDPDRPALEELDGHEDARHEAEHGAQDPQAAEEAERPVVAEERQDRREDPEAVAHDPDLRVAAFRPAPDAHRDLHGAELALEGQDGQLRLQLEARGQDRRLFDVLARHDAVARQEVGELHAEDEVQRAEEEPVAEAVDPAELAPRVVAEPRGDHDVRVAVDDRLDQPGRLLGGVGVVPVDQDVDVGFHFAEGLPDRVPLAAPGLPQHRGARLAGHPLGGVGGVVVHDVELGGWQDSPELPHDEADGGLFVQAGDDDGDPAREVVRHQPVDIS